MKESEVWEEEGEEEEGEVYRVKWMWEKEEKEKYFQNITITL